VRELGNVLQRALILSAGDVLTADDLPREVGPSCPPAPPTPPASAPPAPPDRPRAERARGARGAPRRAARARRRPSLGISWPTLNRKRAKYGVEHASGILGRQGPTRPPPPRSLRSPLAD
jgi:DNA-binding NtrC family response regulator